MIKKLLSFVFILALIVGMLSIGLANSKSQKSNAFEVGVRIVNTDNEPVQGVDVWFYGYKNDKPVLLQEVKTVKDGSANLQLSSLDMVDVDALGDYYDFAVHAAHPSSGVVIEYWSVGVEELKELQMRSKSSNPITLSIDMNKYNTKTMSRGSGVFRNVHISTDQRQEDVVIGKMYQDKASKDTFPIEISYSSGVSNKIETKRAITYPRFGSWDLAGSSTKSTGSSTKNTWTNKFVDSVGMFLETSFMFDFETWEYQEQDVDVYDLWHTRERSIVAKVNRHIGGAAHGAYIAIDSKNLKPFNDVKNGVYGIYAEVGPGGNHQREYKGTQEYTTSLSYSPPGLAKFSVKSTTTYNQKMVLKFGENHPKAKCIYDYNSGESVWYISADKP